MVKARYTYFFDVKTVKDKITRVNINYGGPLVQSAFQDYFTRFKYFKPGSVKINIKPCATLPIDPSGLSYTAAEQTVDPRDIFSLGMCRITNGEQIPDVPSEMSAETSHKFYDNMMLDSRWFKFSPHKGLVKTAYPKYWSISQVRQDHYPGMVVKTPAITYPPQSGEPSGISSVDVLRYNQAMQSGDEAWSTSYSNYQKNVQFLNGTAAAGNNEEFDRALVQNGLEPVHYMPTDEYVKITNVPSNNGTALSLQTFHIWNLAPVPQGQLMVLFFPPSYKTFSYFRVWVTESYSFKGYVNNINVANGDQYLAFQASASIDRSIRPYNGIQQVQPWMFTDRHIRKNLGPYEG